MSTPRSPARVIPESFPGQAEQVAALISRYHASIADRAVMPHMQSGDVFHALPDAAPEQAEALNAVLEDVERLVLPALAHWQHPMFFGYFPANASAPAMLADLLCAGLGVQGMLWHTAPACTELEMRVLDWLAQLLDLPASFRFGSAGASSAGGGGVIQGTASEVVLTAMIAARHALGGTHVPEHCVYASSQAHSSIQKAARMCGVAPDHVRLAPVDKHGAMDVEALGAMIENDNANGRVPAFICATLGTTGTGAFDSLADVGSIAKSCGAWLHVDAAWAGSAFVCPELRAPMRGIEYAASFNFNAHKWMLTNFDCSVVWLNGRTRREQLINAMSITPEYLRNQASDTGQVVDYRDWHIPLGRRFRALKLWFVLRLFGAEGVREHLRRHIELAQWFEAQVRAEPRLELVAPRSLSLVCFAVRGTPERADAHTRALHDRLQRDGRVFLTHTAAPDGRYVLRMAIGSPATEQTHIAKAWEALQAALDDVLGAAAQV